MRPVGARPEQSVAALAHEALVRGLTALAGLGSDVPTALRWLNRAHRLVPHDPNAALVLASACLTHDPERAAALFRGVAKSHDSRQAWLGLATACLRLGADDEAAEAITAVLSRSTFSPDIVAVADAIGHRLGASGWCALRPDGKLEVRSLAPAGTRSADADVSLDGKPVRGGMLPMRWPRGKVIEVSVNGTPLLGCPIQIGPIRRLVGCVEAWNGGIRGWAWHPGDPETPPVLIMRDCLGRLIRTITVRDEAAIPDTGPLSRPRCFQVGRADLAATTGLLHLIGPDGKDLPGSPLDPLADHGAPVPAAAWMVRNDPADTAALKPAARRRHSVLRTDAAVPRHPVGVDGCKRPPAIVLVADDGASGLPARLNSVLDSVPCETRILVVDDGLSDPGLGAALNDLARRQKIELLRHPRPKGYPAAAKAAMRAACDCDIVLLSSDALLLSGWLERLQTSAYSSGDIGTVTPLSNDAGILSYSGYADKSQPPDLAATARLDRAAQRANAGILVDIPVGVNVCLYLRRDCLDAVGLFRADLFAQGGLEESDLCLRARRLGWRNVALTSLFVGHSGGGGIADARAHLRTRNSRILEQRHPGYLALIDDHVARDPLADARRRIDLQRWRQRGQKWQRSAILITHNAGGGVEQRLRHMVRLHQAAGRRVVVLRPAETARGEPAIAVHDGVADDLPNLVFAMPRELSRVLRLLRATGLETVEVHHLADHAPAIYDLVTRLDTSYDVHVHDYAWFCPRISLVGPSNRYCGEPDLQDCEACVADNGHFLRHDITVAALRERSARFLATARRVVVPCNDAGSRMRRHFDDINLATVSHEDDAAIVPVGSAPVFQHAHSASLGARGIARPRRPSVCVVGGIGIHKGYDVLLACARRGSAQP